MKKMQAVTSSVLTGAKTPKLKVKFCNICNPFYYNNSPAIPRYSITCILDPKLDKAFIDVIKKIESEENSTSVLKEELVRGKNENETMKSGRYLVKFQGKDKVPVYLNKSNGTTIEYRIENELDMDSSVIVLYDVIRYVKKDTQEKGLNFKPKAVYIFEEEQKEEPQESLSSKGSTNSLWD